jgi:peptide chain release factor 2
LAKKEAKLQELNELSEDPQLWNDSDAAQRLMKNIAELREEVEPMKSLQQRAKDALELAELYDESLRGDLEPEADAIEAQVAQRELGALLSGPYDRGNALLSINAGAGGTDSQDWAAMLERMYLRWAENRGFNAEILDRTEGEEAGIKSVTIAVNGRYAYGYMRPEKGVHRLVRLSPFDAAHRRHTSFAQVEVLPEVSDADLDVPIHQTIYGSTFFAPPARVDRTCRRMPPRSG